MNAYDTVLFDFGHTLVDLRASDDALRQVYTRIRNHLTSLGYRGIPSVADMVRTVARRIDQLIDESYRGTSLEELDITDLFGEVYREIGISLPQKDIFDIVVMEHEALSAAMVVADGVKETLTALKKVGYRLGVVSNMTNLPEMMRRDLARLELLQYFDVTVFSSATGIRKPHPRIYQVALNGVQSVPTRTVFVGDRIREDVRGPQSLGMRAVLSHQFRQEELDGSRPEKVIQDITEIVGFMELVNSA